jgi:release factor glutamine methyltransferase
MPPSRRPRVAEVLAEAERLLAEAGSETPRLDAEVLFRHAAGKSGAASRRGTSGTSGDERAGWDAARLIVESRSVVDPDVALRFEALLKRRCGREPLAYITGEREFWSRPFRVDSRVLVPRPETEEVVAAALRIAAGLPHPLRVVDVGTGSGAIAVTLTLELAGVGESRVVGLDVSSAALAVARENARRLLPEPNRPSVAWLRGDLTTAIAARSVDLVVANPPYLGPAELAAAEPELEFEPASALLGGDSDGLGVLRRLLEDARRVLRPHGVLVSEIGWGQGAKVASLASRVGFEEVEVARDLAGHERVLIARCSSAARVRFEDQRGGDGWTRSSFEGGARSRARFGSAVPRTPPSRSSSRRC